MSIPKSPFAPSSSSPGTGRIVVSSLPPQKQILTSLDYQYPLKLIAPDSHNSPEEPHHAVTLVFLLTYGGGLVGGDQVKLDVELEPYTRLVLVTQGSTKIFKSPTRTTTTRQVLDVKVGERASLCYLPDPTQPFEQSIYEQIQTFHVDPYGTSSLCVLDWINEGRRARGEIWTLWSWKGKNEVRECSEGQPRGRLLLRDAVMLSDGGVCEYSGINNKTNEMGVIGTLIVSGPTFSRLGTFLMSEFNNMPRIGAKKWSDDKFSTTIPTVSEHRTMRLAQEQADGVLWTAANSRGFVVVKFGARQVDGAKRWLGSLLKHEGTVEQEFGHQALIGLR